MLTPSSGFNAYAARIVVTQARALASRPDLGQPNTDRTVARACTSSCSTPGVFQRKVIVVKTHYASSLALVIAILLLSGAASRSVGAQNNRQENWEPPVVYQASGPNNASITGALDEFRNALGGGNNGNTAGPLADGRREINWDGGGAATTPAGTPFTGFLNNRGALLTTPGSGFVQAPPSGLATTFGNLSYEGIFRAFSQQRLFSSIGDSRTDLTFFIPGSNGASAATTRAFGVIFTDVDQPDGSERGYQRENRPSSTLIEYFAASGERLFSGVVASAPGNGNFSFFGAIFPDARIGRVVITAGDYAGPDDSPTRDVVMMDDFIYAEPRVR
jgi:hypothetical protein